MKKFIVTAKSSEGPVEFWFDEIADAMEFMNLLWEKWDTLFITLERND